MAEQADDTVINSNKECLQTTDDQLTDHKMDELDNTNKTRILSDSPLNSMPYLTETSSLKGSESSSGVSTMKGSESEASISSNKKDDSGIGRSMLCEDDSHTTDPSGGEMTECLVKPEDDENAYIFSPPLLVSDISPNVIESCATPTEEVPVSSLFKTLDKLTENGTNVGKLVGGVEDAKELCKDVINVEEGASSVGLSNGQDVGGAMKLGSLVGSAIDTTEQCDISKIDISADSSCDDADMSGSKRAGSNGCDDADMIGSKRAGSNGCDDADMSGSKRAGSNGCDDADNSGFKRAGSNSSLDSDDDSEPRAESRPKRARNYRRRRLDSSSSDDDDDDIESGVVQERRPFIGPMLPSDNEGNHSDNESTDTNENSDKSDQSEGEDVDLGPPPRDTWFPLKELVKREMGYSNKYPMAQIFRTRAGASVHFVQRFQEFHKLEKHDGCVNALHFNKPGTLLASGSDDLRIVVWDWKLGKPYFHFDSGHRSNVFQSKFMPYSGDTHIVSCARDGYVRLAELSSTGTCKGTRKLAVHAGSAHKLSLLEDSSHVFYSCGEDAVTFEVDLRQPKPNKLGVTKENDRKVALYSVHANPSKSHEYCVGGRDQFIRIYDSRMGREGTYSTLKKYCPQQMADDTTRKCNVTCAVYNYNGTEVIGTYNDDDIYLFNTSDSDGANFTYRYTGHRNSATVKGVNFYGPKSEFIVSGSDCGNVFLWQKNSQQIVNYFHADDGGVINVLEPHPHCPVLATSGLDSDVKVWMPTAREKTELKGLQKRIKKNKKERDSERSLDGGMDDPMIWMLLQHLQRRARRRAREEDPELSLSSSDDASTNSDLESDNEDEGQPRAMQCATQ